MTAGALDSFHPIVRRWFERTFREPSPAQVQGWPSIARGENTLILAPTGSGKTLAAFLWAINHLVEQHLREVLPPGVRILYVSPLKALNNDIQRNLVAPLEGIAREAEREGVSLPSLRSAVRTGDTSQAERNAMLRRPPDILITTPESLYLLLTSPRALGMLRTVQYVIVDEIHSVCGNKRGAHLTVSLERLQEVAEQDFVRIGLSATQRPLERIAAFLVGQQWERDTLVPRPVTIIDAGERKNVDLRVLCAAPDFSLLPQEGVWPLVFQEILDEIRHHRSTLIFVNNRRLAERVAAALNTLIASESGIPDSAPSAATNLYAVPRPITMPGPESTLPPVQAYHGSMSREARDAMEQALKKGAIRALVATSALELGIDIGALDCVIQIQSPHGVARGLQRIGRSGHLVDATSIGRIFPSHREDLVEAAVVARAMLDNDVEETSIPVDCLDVLAQQIVAMVSIREWNTEGLYALLRRSYTFRDLPRALYNGVLTMLAGRTTDTTFRELRARISWDTVNGTLRALPGSGRLAVTGGGTIADRGAYGVYREDGATRVGEVDEEFVFESRTGDTFLLGSSVWRITAIDRQRVIVAPAPGEPARMPFWRGEGIGRGFALGARVGAFRRDMGARIHSADCLAWLQSTYPIDSRAAWNIEEYFRKQHQVAGVIPHDRLILVEGFRDEIGDPRLIVHSAFGRRVNTLLALVLTRTLQTLTGVEPQSYANDDGILLRCPDLDTLPLRLFDGLTLDSAVSIVLADVVSSPLFAGQFRQNAARALLLPRPFPGKRTPLWLQRLHAADLLQVARQFDDFPIVIETMREVLNDILDLEHFKEVVHGIEQGTIGVTARQTEIPSPFAASLLFEFLAIYMYEQDQPRTDRMSQYLAVNRELLAEVVDLDTLPSLLRPEAIETVEGQLQHSVEGWRARSPEELLEVLLRVGDLSDKEVELRCAGDAHAFLAALETTGRAARIHFPDGLRWIAGEERAVYADLQSEGNASHVLRRFLQSHGPVTASEVARRYGLPADRVDVLAERLAQPLGLARGRFRPAGENSADEPQWCTRSTLAKIHRQTLGILRREIVPATFGEFTRFLLAWQHIVPATQLRGSEGVARCIDQLLGLPLPAESWERDILRNRIRDYDPSLLDEQGARGDIVWTGRGQGRMTPLRRGEAALYLGTPGTDAVESLHDGARRVRECLRMHGASFFDDIRRETTLSLAALNNALAELFWGGTITNDVFSELQKVKQLPRVDDGYPPEPIQLTAPYHNPQRAGAMRRARQALRQVPGWTGRWSLVHTPGVMGPSIPLDEAAERQALQLLARYGIVAREFRRREDLLPWAALSAQLQRMEMRGTIRRGYFVEGLSGMQHALPEAVDALRLIRSEPPRDDMLCLNAADPANPYGTGVTLGGITLPRTSSAYIIVHTGDPVLLIEGNGARMRTGAACPPAILEAAIRTFTDLLRLPPRVKPFRDIVVEYFNGERPAASAAAPILHQLGFIRDKDQTMRRESY